MNLFNRSPRLLAFALTAFALTGCVISAGPGTGPPYSGTLTVFSSIDGSTHPAECDYFDANDLELAVYEGSRHYTTVIAPCYDFQVSVSLPEGDYNADVTLLDRYAYPVSTTLTLDNLFVVAGTDLQVDVDFPLSSILQ